MKITTITASFGRTQSLGNYSNAKASVTLTAELDEGEDRTAAHAQLRAEARALVDEEIDQALEAEGEHAKFSREPRYRLAFTAEEIYRGGWGNRNKIPAPEKLLVLLPQRISPHAADFPGRAWWSEPYGPSQKLRLSHAQDAAAAWLVEHAGYRLIDCADGDLSRVPAWAIKAPPEPEPEAAPVAAAPLDDDDFGDDEGQEGDDDE